MDLDYIIQNAPKWNGTPGLSKKVYFGPDEEAIFGRYWDGRAMSEHPSNEEISEYWEFWVALANAEQKQIVQGMFDMAIATDFASAVKEKSDYEVVETAVKWWIQNYAWEYREFTQYIEEKKATLYNSQGWDRGKTQKFSGAIPQRVRQLVLGARPELLRMDANKDCKFIRLFYSIYTKAQIGGN